jgi:hypothetical protein
MCATIIVTMLVPVIVFAQLHPNDSIEFKISHKTPEFNRHLKSSMDISTITVSLAGNIIWLAPAGYFSMYDINTIWGLGFAGFGFALSISPDIDLTEAKKILISGGFDKIPGNDFYRAVSHALAMTVATTLAGLASTGLAVYGIANQSEVLFGIGLGSAIAIAFISALVPVMIHDALEINNKDALPSLKVNVTNDGIGMVYRF